MDAWWWVVWFWKLVTEYRNSNRSQGCRLSKSPPSPCLLLSAPLTLLQPHRPPRCSCCLPDMLLPLGALVLCLWCSPPRSPDGLLFPSFRLCTGLPWPLHLKLHCLPPIPLPVCSTALWRIWHVTNSVVYCLFPPDETVSSMTAPMFAFFIQCSIPGA